MEEKQKLSNFFEEIQLQPLILVSHVIISNDLVHDSAFVQHAIDKLFVPWLREHLLQPPQRLYATSDGAPNQFKYADHFWWISNSHNTGFATDWLFYPTAHGKDDSDPDLGKCKSVGSKHQTKAAKCEVAKIYSAEEFYEFLKEKMQFPKKDIYMKKGVGIFRRIFHFIPISGPLSISRKIQKCETVKGTKTFHELRNVGQEGFLEAKLASCFNCAKCIQGIQNECENVERTGIAKIVQVRPVQAATRMMTRNVLKQQALHTANSCSFGDFIAFELFNHTQAAFMIGMVVGEVISVESTVENWTGTVRKGSKGIKVQRLQPTSPGGLFLYLTDDQLIANVEHIISGKLHLEMSQPNNTRGGTLPKYKLDSDSHSLILRCLQKDEPIIEDTDSNSKESPANAQPGDENFDHKLLMGMKLLVPCKTWNHEQARSFFGRNYRDKTTTAFVRKIRYPNTKKVEFELEFPEIPSQLYKSWIFDLEYVLKYACELS